jgi:hypothetical protein
MGGDHQRDGPDYGEEEAREDRQIRITRKIRRIFIDFLRNQLAGLDSESLTPDQIDWKKVLEAEISALESDRLRLPWRDGLPEQTAASLEPFRSSLEDSYNKTLNALEFPADGD